MLSVIDNENNDELPNLSFEEFWALFYKNYPRKRMPERAKRAALKIAPQEYIEVLVGLDRFIKYLQAEHREQEFIPYPATWINGGCWQDEYEIKINGHASYVHFEKKEEKFIRGKIPDTVLQWLNARK